MEPKSDGPLLEEAAAGAVADDLALVPKGSPKRLVEREAEAAAGAAG